MLTIHNLVQLAYSPNLTLDEYFTNKASDMDSYFNLLKSDIKCISKAEHVEISHTAIRKLKSNDFVFDS